MATSKPSITNSPKLRWCCGIVGFCVCVRCVLCMRALFVVLYVCIYIIIVLHVYVSRIFSRSYSGGYGAKVPPLPIPNREVKLRHADGTAQVGE